MCTFPLFFAAVRRPFVRVHELAAGVTHGRFPLHALRLRGDGLRGCLFLCVVGGGELFDGEAEIEDHVDCPRRWHAVSLRVLPSVVLVRRILTRGRRKQRACFAARIGSRVARALVYCLRGGGGESVGAHRHPSLPLRGWGLVPHRRLGRPQCGWTPVPHILGRVWLHPCPIRCVPGHFPRGSGWSPGSRSGRWLFR